ATLHLLPTLWFRNTWSWGRTGEGYWSRGRITRHDGTSLAADHASLGSFRLAIEPPAGQPEPALLFTENESNFTRLWGTPNPSPYVKDAFHRHLVAGEAGAGNPTGPRRNAAAPLPPPPAARARAPRPPPPLPPRPAPDPPLCAEAGGPQPALGPGFDAPSATRRAEADAYHASLVPPEATDAERQVSRQASAGLVWTRQFYAYSVAAWLDGDPGQPPPPPSR